MNSESSERREILFSGCKSEGDPSAGTTYLPIPYYTEGRKGQGLNRVNKASLSFIPTRRFIYVAG